ALIVCICELQVKKKSSTWVRCLFLSNGRGIHHKSLQTVPRDSVRFRITLRRAVAMDRVASPTRRCSRPSWIAPICWLAAARTRGCALGPQMEGAVNIQRSSLLPTWCARRRIAPGTARGFIWGPAAYGEIQRSQRRFVEARSADHATATDRDRASALQVVQELALELSP